MRARSNQRNYGFAYKLTLKKSFEPFDPLATNIAKPCNWNRAALGHNCLKTLADYSTRPASEISRKCDHSFAVARLGGIFCSISESDDNKRYSLQLIVHCWNNGCERDSIISKASPLFSHIERCFKRLESRHEIHNMSIFMEELRCVYKRRIRNSYLC